MLEVDDKKDRSRSTNDVVDGDNLPAFWLNNVWRVGGSETFYKINTRRHSNISKITVYYFIIIIESPGKVISKL